MASPQFSFFDSPTHSQKNLYRLRIVVWLITICAGFLQVWAARFDVSPDGNCYLDIATAYLHGDWHNAVNAYWSPVFSWLLAVSLAIFHPNSYWESTLLHLLNFVALLVSLSCFEFFLKAFLRARRQLHWTENDGQGLSDLSWWVLGYGLFLSASLFVLTASITTPDVWVAALTYLAAALVIRIHSNGASWGLFAALGSVLGCAYLAKTFYFPLSFVFLGTAWLATGNPRKAIKQSVFGLCVFSFIAGPWVGILSSAKGRATFGDVGKLALVIRLAPLQQPFFWQGENGTGIPRHPVRQLLVKPSLFEFGTPVGGSYPPAYDQTYWMEGARLRPTLKGLLLVIRQSAGTMFVFLIDQAEYAAGLLFLFFLVRAQAGWTSPLRKRWFLWVPPLIACLAYAAVLVEGRYVAPFVLLLWIAGFSCLSSSLMQVWRPAILAFLLAMVTLTGLRVAKFAVTDLLAHAQNTDYEIAQGLLRLDIQPGDKVAGFSRVAEAHWARLAGVKIVAEMPLGSELDFWTASPELQRKVLETVAETGAKAIVSNHPLSAISPGWRPLANTGYWMLLLSTETGRRNSPLR